MIPALLTFSHILTGAALLVSLAFIGFGVHARATDTPAALARMRLTGMKRRPLAPPVVAAVVSAAWLWATWGVA